MVYVLRCHDLRFCLQPSLPSFICTCSIQRTSCCFQQGCRHHIKGCRFFQGTRRCCLASSKRCRASQRCASLLTHTNPNSNTRSSGSRRRRHRHRVGHCLDDRLRCRDCSSWIQEQTSRTQATRTSTLSHRQQVSLAIFIGRGASDGTLIGGVRYLDGWMDRYTFALGVCIERVKWGVHFIHIYF